MVPGFQRELMTAKDRGVEYAVFVGKRNVSEKEMIYPSSKHEIRIAPITGGRKSSGLWQTIGGVALAVVGAVSGLYGNPYAGQMVMMGAALALGGIAQMISAHMGTQNGSPPTSYSFSGAQNVTSQGGPVPVLYGEMLVGSTVISSAIQSQDQ